MYVKWCPVIGRCQIYHMTWEIWPEAETFVDFRRVSGFVWQQSFNKDTPSLRSFPFQRALLSFIQYYTACLASPRIISGYPRAFILRVLSQPDLSEHSQNERTRAIVLVKSREYDKSTN